MSLANSKASVGIEGAAMNQSPATSESAALFDSVASTVGAIANDMREAANDAEVSGLRLLERRAARRQRREIRGL